MLYFSTRLKLSPRFFLQFSNYSNDLQSSSLRSLNVCLFGQHQAGKTLLSSTLTKVLSKVNSTQYVPVDVLDGNEQEQKSGSTINISFASINIGNAKVSLIDCPGRDELLSSRIKGLTLAHLGILVVSSDTPYILDTIHKEISLAKHFNLKEIVLFLTKSDLKSLDDQTKESIKKLLHQFGYQTNLMLSGSLIKPHTEPGIQQLIDFIDKFPSPVIDSSSPLRLKTIIVKTLSSNDSYIHGYLEQGSIEIGQNVTVMGKGREFDVYVSKIIPDLAKAEAGSLCQLMVRGNRCKWLKKGMIITNPGSFQANDHFNCTIKSLSTDGCLKDILDGVQKLYLYSDQVSSTCNINDLDYYATNQMYKCNLKLSDSLVLSKGYPFALAFDKKLVGLGKVDQILDNLNVDEKMNIFRVRSNEKNVQT